MNDNLIDSLPEKEAPATEAAPVQPEPEESVSAQPEAVEAAAEEPVQPVTEEPQAEVSEMEAPVEEEPEEDAPAAEVPEEEPEETVEAEPEEPAQPEMVSVVDIHFRSNTKVYFFDPGDLELADGDHVVIDTARGQEFGYCATGNHQVSAKDIVPPLRRVLRKATEKDERINNENIQKEKKAYEICQQKIQSHGLDMQLVRAECAFDGSKIIFFFTADGRVDFRELVKNLASVFRTRIELRQIGVRDKAKMVGGLGICGRPFCCKEFLDDFQPVSIKMAKTQNLSLNPTKISGTCGRLMCCLKYEQDAYEDLLKTSPKVESFVDTVDGRGTVIDSNLLKQTVRVRMEDQPDQIGCYKNCDICVLRNGKAKKNDPPIPRDLAPISSNPHPAAKAVEKPDFDPLPDVIITGRDMPPIKPYPDDLPDFEAPAAPQKQEQPKQVNRSSSQGDSRNNSNNNNGGSNPNHRRRRKKPAAPAADGAPKQDSNSKEKPQQQNRPQKSKQDNRPKPDGSKPRQDNRPPRKPRPEGKPEGRPEGAPKAEGGKPNNYHRRRRRPHSGPKPNGGAPKAE